jgi:cytochrome P450
LSSREAIEQYSQAADKEISVYVEKLAEREKQNPHEPIYLVPEIKSLCLQIFAKIFSGQGLTEKQEQQFNDYNDALLSLSRGTDQYKKGRNALDELRVVMLQRFRALDDPNIASDSPGKWYHDQICDRPNFGDNEERISTGMILFIWGAYIECASLMVDALGLSYKYGLAEKASGIRKEYAMRRETGIPSSDPKFWDDMPYTNGICRETLRIAPPGAGVPRFSYDDFELSGYRIPGEYPVMLDPRIGNMDPTLYTEPNNFEPLRWVPLKEGAGTSSCPFQGSALKLGMGSWFPGGFGAHQCPGVPLAELVGRMFLAKMAVKFESWSFNGDGLTKDGDIDYVKIPVRIPPDNFGMQFTLRE